MRRLPLLFAAAALLAVSACDSGSGSTAGPPRTARIIKVSVDAAPLADENGDGWDGGSNPLGDGPEVYFRLFDDAYDYQTEPDRDRLNPRDDANVEPQASRFDWYDNVGTADFSLVWDVDPGHTVRDLDAPLYLALFDYDPTTGDDPMAESEVFTLRDVAPATVDGQADVVTLSGFDRDGAALGADFRVRLTVVFDD